MNSIKTDYFDILSKLQAIVAHGNPYWNIDAVTGARLQDIIRTNQYTDILEIGTSIGVSAIYMAAAVYETGGHITTVESHAERFALATEHFIEAGISDSITQVLGHAPEVLDQIPGTFDFLFFDATKMEHILYYTHLKNRLRSGGTLVADNVMSHEAMQPFLNVIDTDTDFVVHVEPIGTGLLVAKKIA